MLYEISQDLYVLMDMALLLLLMVGVKKLLLWICEQDIYKFNLLTLPYYLFQIYRNEYEYASFLLYTVFVINVLHACRL